MNNIILNPKSLLIRWAWLFERKPHGTDVCIIFWRTMVLTPLKLVLPPAVFMLLLYGLFYNTAEFLKVIGVIVAMVLGMLTIIWCAATVGWQLSELKKYSNEKGICSRVFVEELKKRSEG